MACLVSPPQTKGIKLSPEGTNPPPPNLMRSGLGLIGGLKVGLVEQAKEASSTSTMSMMSSESWLVKDVSVENGYPPTSITLDPVGLGSVVVPDPESSFPEPSLPKSSDGFAGFIVGLKQ